MSNLEKEVKPILTPMLTKFDAVALDKSEQRLLATWAWKTFLAHDGIHPEGGIPETEYTQFFATRRPPDNSVIWIGACALIHNAGVSHVRLMVPEPQGRNPDGPVFIAGVFGALHVFFHCYLHVSGRKERIRDSDMRRNTLSRIWPIDHGAIIWPPHRFWFNDKLLDSFVWYDDFFDEPF